MLEICINTFHEGTHYHYFREFAYKLSGLFKFNNLSGLLIGNPNSESDNRIQLDAILITRHAVCLLNFINSDTNIYSEENFQFFKQIELQKKVVSEFIELHLSKSFSSGDRINAQNIINVVYTKNEIDESDKRYIKNQFNLLLYDQEVFTNNFIKIIDIYDDSTLISKDSANEFRKALFNRFLIEKSLLSQEGVSLLDYNILKSSQVEALHRIKSFLESNGKKLFFLNGSSRSGKSFLIPYIKEIAFRLSFKMTEVITPTYKSSESLKDEYDIEDVRSLDSVEDMNKINKVNENLKYYDFSVLIIDDAHLVSDLETITDWTDQNNIPAKNLLNLISSIKAHQKFIFIGDPYQLKSINQDVIDKYYIESPKILKTEYFELDDNPEFSDIVKQSLTCVESIRNHDYSYLNFYNSEQVHLLPPEQVNSVLSKIIKKYSGRVLCYNNEDAYHINLYIKNKIIQNGNKISVNDLLITNNSFEALDLEDEFAKKVKINKGEFAIVTGVSESLIVKKVPVPKHPDVKLEFREIFVTFLGSGLNAQILSCENFRLSLNGKLSVAEKQGLEKVREMIYQSFNTKYHFVNSPEYKELIESKLFRELTIRMKEFKQKLVLNDEEKARLSEFRIKRKQLTTEVRNLASKRKMQDLLNDYNSEINKFKNIALLRYGWALTVKNSMSYKWDDVVLNLHSENIQDKTSANYFRLLYTGAMRANNNLYLLNFEQITFLYSTSLVDKNKGTINFPQDIFISINNENIEIIDFIKFIEELFKSTEITMEWKEINDSLIKFAFHCQDKTAYFDAEYDKHGFFKPLKYVEGNFKLSLKIIDALEKRKFNFNFNKIFDDWKLEKYSLLAKELEVFNIRIIQLIQNELNDKIKLTDNVNILEIDVDFKKTEVITKITAYYYSEKSIWENFKQAVNNYRKKNQIPLFKFNTINNTY